ncbi:MAG: dimethyl sulfoxide reductase anchor subunit [Proteobacteria bacterium]|nr:dimethyl sulfoxide reductase anchor subunit [Pseudomonadota bacterium]
MTNTALQQSEITLKVAQIQPNSGMRRQGLSIDIQFNKQFGFLETFSFLGEGVGAVLYIVGAIIGSLPVAVLGTFFVFLAVGALLGHLGTPFRTWRALTNGARSLASRGTIAMSGFLAVSAIWLVMEFMKLQGVLGAIIFGASLLLAVPVVFYAGFLLRSVRAIGLWRGPYLPLAFGTQSLASGLVVFVFLAHLDSANTEVMKWLGAAIVSLILCALISLVHLATSKRTRGVSASLDRILHGDLRARFYWGVWCLGIVVPLIVFSVQYFGNPQDGGNPQLLLLAVTVVSRLIGDYAYRRVIVLAGAYESIIG